MTNYVQTTFFTPKDTLPVTDPNKTIFGAAYDVEFGNIATAIASKYDTTSTPTFAGAVTAPAFIPNGTSVPINGMYLSAAHTVSFAANGVFEGSFNGGMVLGAPTGSFKGVGTLNATALYINGTALGTVTGFAIPTGLATLAASAGAATTAIRSDANIAIDQTISPIWTGNHTFTPGSGTGVAIHSLTTVASLIAGIVGATNNPRLFITSTEASGLTDINFSGTSNFNGTLSVGGTSVVALSNTRNVTINAPSSGSTITIIQLANVAGIISNSASGFNGIEFQENSVGKWRILEAFSTAGAISFYSLTTAAEQVKITGAGNMSIAAPSSGATLALNFINNVGGLTFTDATATGEFVFNAGHTLEIGTITNHGLGLFVNNGSFAFLIASSGAISIAAPTSSAIATTITGAANNVTLQINANSTNAQSFGLLVEGGTTSADYGFQVTNQAGTHRYAIVRGDGSATYGYNGSTDSIAISAAGVTTVNVSGTTVFSVNGTASPTIQGYGPTAAALVDMTPDTGTFTITYTGMTTTVTGTAIWARHGNQVMLILPAATGTSNATTMTATGLPAAIQPTHAQTLTLGGAIVENNGFISLADTECSLAAGSGTITFTFAPVNATLGGGFTNSGTKGIALAATIAYVLN